MSEWAKAGRGLGAPIDGTFRFTINFADDYVLIARDEYNLQFMLEGLHNFNNNWGLETNIVKTEHVCTAFQPQETEVTVRMKVQVQLLSYINYISVRRS